MIPFVISVTAGALPIQSVSIGSEQGVKHAVLAETAVEGKLTLLPGPSFFRRERGETRQRIIRPG
jgi:hypothetical protein